MKNNLADLNDHLFMQFERLADESLTPEQIKREAKRGAAMVAVADQIIRSASVQLAAARLVSDHGLDPTPHIPAVVRAKQSLQIEGKKQ
ncbi:hypothetical protein [Methylovirgula sp. HY1]|uniref:hypothetical protein n=1 Tax=Methylovirgula sp. HY1 TaxID=2822761 RepID=UPI001C5A8F5E|nr:hypothetical protein [Methylovirgula sp. HY1]QXX74278.1 hypothetical protein MHY1_01088 [Methylovirgula sp. HY1]